MEAVITQEEIMDERLPAVLTLRRIMRRPLLAMPIALVVVACVLFLSPSRAHAYVDPGFLSVLHQIAYVAIFGALSAVIFKPWRLLKSRFKKSSSSKPPDEPCD